MEALKTFKVALLAILLGIGLCGGLIACTLDDGWRGYDIGSRDSFHDDMYLLIHDGSAYPFCALNAVAARV